MAKNVFQLDRYVDRGFRAQLDHLGTLYFSTLKKATSFCEKKFRNKTDQPFHWTSSADGESFYSSNLNNRIVIKKLHLDPS